MKSEFEIERKNKREREMTTQNRMTRNGGKTVNGNVKIDMQKSIEHEYQIEVFSLTIIRKNKRKSEKRRIRKR